MPTQNFQLLQQRAFSQSINRARFEITDDFQIAGPRPMTLTSKDAIDQPNRNQSIQLKDVTARCVLPICLDENFENPVVLPAVGSYNVRHTYTFYISINGSVVLYPVAFISNADTEKSILYFAQYNIPVKSLSVSVIRDFIPAPFDGPGLTVDLILEIESFPFNADTLQ